MDKLFCYGGILEKASPGKVTHKCVYGWRRSPDEESALGSVVIALQNEWPGWSIGNIAVTHIPTDDGWQPMASAPKDGTKINAYGRESDGRENPSVRTGTIYWHEGRWLGGPFNSHCEPEWWQPFPAIPVQSLDCGEEQP